MNHEFHEQAKNNPVDAIIALEQRIAELEAKLTPTAETAPAETTPA